MKNLKILSLFLIFFGLTVVSCELDDVPNPNGSSVNDLLNDASSSEMQTLVTGIEELLRIEIGFYYDVTSIIGRDYWFFTGSDPRYTGELLGRLDSQLDDAGFYGTRPYSGRYRTVKNANILIDAATNSTQINDSERSGYFAFANTIKAYESLLVLNLQYQNGIRVDVADPDNLGPFLTYDESLSAIHSLLNEAAGQLASADFAFVLSPGFENFDSPTSFAQFNEALASRVATYQGNSSSALEHLASSFYSSNGDFDFGPSRYYSAAGGEQLNEVFRPTNQADAIIAHPDFVLQLDPADDRSAKVELRDAPLSLDDLTGDYDVVVFPEIDSKIPLISNEELILIHAEANIGSDNMAAESSINIIREGHGLDPVNGLSTAELVDEMLAQRRLSLFGEGHRWVDMRRYDRLDQLAIDRVDDNVWAQLPRPSTE